MWTAGGGLGTALADIMAVSWPINPLQSQAVAVQYYILDSVVGFLWITLNLRADSQGWT